MLVQASGAVLRLPSGPPGSSTLSAVLGTSPAALSSVTAGREKVENEMFSPSITRITIDWDFGHFRDCNGVSNGARLDPQTLTREARAGSFVGSPAGLIGPRLELRSV